MRSRDDGRERRCLQAAAAGWGDELIVVEELSVVNVGLLWEEKGEEIEVRMELCGGRVGEEGALDGGSAVRTRRRWCRRIRCAR